MCIRTLLGIGALCVATLATAGPPSARDAHRADDKGADDLFFGEAVYYARQGHYFDALERLDAELGQHRTLDEPELDSLYRYLRDAEFSVGDFELEYRMHLRAGHAITAVLEGAVDERIRNDAAYRLARIHFQNGQLEDALQALDKIQGKVPEAIRGDVEFLRANVYLGLGRSEDAVAVLKRVQGVASLNGFVAYNLGVALLDEGRRDDALAQLERAGQVGGSDESVLAIRDKSNLVLGTLLADSGQSETAKRFFDRVRLDGPFSNAALLASGWAAARGDDFERAVVPWGLLAEREPTDVAVQEAKLALPFAYGKLDVHGRAALSYASALESFGGEIDKLDASIASIRDGKFLKALVREEIRQNTDWVIRLRSLPESPETYYLMELAASHDFQTAVQNYLDLDDLRRKLATWDVSFAAFDDMIGLRREYYEPLLPGVDADFRGLDSRMRLRIEQDKLLKERLQGLLTAPRPDFLATADERLAAEQLTELESGLAGLDTPQAEALRQRIGRLRGVLTFTMRTEYHERLAAFDRHLTELAAALDVLNARYDAFVRSRQAAVHSYEGYDTPIARLRTRTSDALADVNRLVARQGHILEVVAIDELTARRERLAEYQDQARYALADSYDRATKARAEAEVAAVGSGSGGQ
ncbi:MAG TPA: tetratricopeptide repeat protein [Gammaproteobacteria bacterium]|nr:tetratricopeptide repeat protein [Gammaproteobacteria bacterium]